MTVGFCKYCESRASQGLHDCCQECFVIREDLKKVKRKSDTDRFNEVIKTMIEERDED